MELSAPQSPQAHLKESACFFNRSRSCVFYNNAFGAAAAIGLRTLTICQLFSKNANLIGIHATAILLQISLQRNAAPNETAAAPLVFYCERATALQ